LPQHGDSDNGKGIFTPQIVFQGYPLWGHSSFELTGFNGDNRPDFIVTTCDNGEYPSSTKPYHGIRIFLKLDGAKFQD
jgi:hypothetical protein